VVSAALQVYEFKKLEGAKSLRILILTALQLEALAVRAHLDGLRTVAHDSGTLYEEGVLRFGRKEIPVLLCQTGTGNARAALEAERAINFFAPSHAFFVGVAGGLKDVALYDVVAATKVYGFESGKADKTFRPRPEMGHSSYAMAQHAQKVSQDNKWKARILGFKSDDVRSFVGPIAAGEKVVTSFESSTFKLLKETYGDALAVEMEGFGMLTAVHASAQVQSLVVRGISDLIDNKSQSDAGGSQERASANAAAFTFQVIESLTETGQVTFATDDLWESLEQIVVQLYPKGPDDASIWSRSGGDQSSLAYSTSPRGAWHTALKTLRLGGGGHGISPRSLFSRIREDFPSNHAVEQLIQSWP
jgi:adenosylhomocysteine nucleosidase